MTYLTSTIAVPVWMILLALGVAALTSWTLRSLAKIPRDLLRLTQTHREIQVAYLRELHRKAPDHVLGTAAGLAVGAQIISHDAQEMREAFEEMKT